MKRFTIQLRDRWSHNPFSLFVAFSPALSDAYASFHYATTLRGTSTTNCAQY